MTIQQLQYVLALDAERNFVRAAEKCFVTQPSLTMQVQKLEDELGVKIFDRSRKPLISTPIGEQIIAQARIAVQESNRIIELVKESQNELSGELRVGIIPTLSPYLLPLFAANFEASYPKIRLLIQELQTDVIVEYLRKDELDLGILVTPLKEVGIKESPLFLEPMMGYVGKQHRLASKETIRMEDLDLDDTWLLAEGHCLRAQVLNICKAHQRYDTHNLVFESGSIETLERLVESHKGMTILPYLATLNLTDVQREMLRKFDGAPPVREVSIVKNRVEVKKAMIEALAETIKRSLPDELFDAKGVVVPI